MSSAWNDTLPGVPGSAVVVYQVAIQSRKVPRVGVRITSDVFVYTWYSVV